MSHNEGPPVILLGGGANALSIARSLGGRGIPVYALNHAAAHVRYSRFARWVPLPEKGADGGDPRVEYLLGEVSKPLRGSVLLTASDDGIELIAAHREALAERYLLDISHREAQICLLNKLLTYQAAEAAGVPTPRFWTAESRDDILALRDSLVFPLLVKPVLSHLFQQRFKAKFLTAGSFEELAEAWKVAEDARIEVVLMEMIPGPDTKLCSYYTYIDEAGEPLFHFTKRVIRRYPTNMGIASYHITDHNPEVQEHSLRLFRHVGLRGLGNAEFKHDDRDGRLKLIECNCRFTAANALVAAAGFDLPFFVYNRLTGREQPPLVKYQADVRLLDLVRDIRAFLELRAAGELSLGGWLGSLAHPHVPMWFRADDPLPSVMSVVNTLRKTRT